MSYDYCKALENPFCLLSLRKLFLALCDDWHPAKKAVVLMSETYTCQGSSGTSAVNPTAVPVSWSCRADCPPAGLPQQLRAQELPDIKTQCLILQANDSLGC